MWWKAVCKIGACAENVVLKGLKRSFTIKPQAHIQDAHLKKERVGMTWKPFQSWH